MTDNKKPKGIILECLPCGSLTIHRQHASGYHCEDHPPETGAASKDGRPEGHEVGRCRTCSGVHPSPAFMGEVAEDPNAVVAEQADDEVLWLVDADGQEAITEAMLRMALRRLHAAVEGVPCPPHVQKGKFSE